MCGKVDSRVFRSSKTDISLSLSTTCFAILSALVWSSTPWTGRGRVFDFRIYATLYQSRPQSSGFRGLISRCSFMNSLCCVPVSTGNSPSGRPAGKQPPQAFRPRSKNEGGPGRCQKSSLSPFLLPAGNSFWFFSLSLISQYLCLTPILCADSLPNALPFSEF